MRNRKCVRTHADTRSRQYSRSTLHICVRVDVSLFRSDLTTERKVAVSSVSTATYADMINHEYDDLCKIQPENRICAVKTCVLMTSLRDF